MVRRELLDGDTCKHCRQTPEGAVTDIDERIRILAQRPMEWEERPSVFDRWR
ncbi:MAG: hypothetical protein AB2L14_29810 [Candidatus Xenobiia bacterium LiM19]